MLHDKGKVVDRTIAHLRKLKYLIDDAVMDAVAIGVPQRRRRHFVVASREHQPDILATVSAFERPKRSVNWAIGDLARAACDSAFDQTGTPSPVNRERIDYLFTNNLFELPDEMRPDCHRLQAHATSPFMDDFGLTHPRKPSPAGFSVWDRAATCTPQNGGQSLLMRQPACSSFLTFSNSVASRSGRRSRK